MPTDPISDRTLHSGAGQRLFFNPAGQRAPFNGRGRVTACPRGQVFIPPGSLPASPEELARKLGEL